MVRNQSGNKRGIIALIVILLLIALTIFLTVTISRIHYEKKLKAAEEAAPKITAMTVSQKLEKISELATENCFITDTSTMRKAPFRSSTRKAT